MTQLRNCDTEPAAGKTRLEIYTDGSSLGNPGPSGWGFVAVLLEASGNVVVESERSGGSRLATNSRAELAAAIAALTFAAKDHPGVPVTIFSDSQYVVKGFTEWLPGWMARGWRKSKGEVVGNRDLWERLLAAAAGMALTWRWVEAHKGHAFNERADALARVAAETARSNDLVVRPAA